ncbi:MAG: hypothetical protein KGL99_05170 [Burkholderiales bacterium]|nr:hypothetical protein [Burkholderiales bacterium]
MKRPNTWIAALAAWSAVACSPALDWREFVPEGSGLIATFPCRPERQTRPVTLAGAKVPMTVLACTADGATYALGFVTVVDPGRITATLAELRASAVANLQGAAVEVAPLLIKGMSANDQAARLTFAGRLPNGAAVQEHAAFFTHGLHVYQATVFGAKPARRATDTFLGGLKFPT